MGAETGIYLIDDHCFPDHKTENRAVSYELKYRSCAGLLRPATEPEQTEIFHHEAIGSGIHEQETPVQNHH